MIRRPVSIFCSRRGGMTCSSWIQSFCRQLGIEDYRPVTITSNVVSLTVEEPREEWFASRVWRPPWGCPSRVEDYAVGRSSWSDTSR